MTRKNVIVLLALTICVGIVYAVTTSSPWTGAGWDTTAPSSDALVGNTYKEIYDLRKGVGIRMNYEHETLASSSVGGGHSQGAATCYFQDGVPATDGDTTHFTTALDAGTLWIDTNGSPADNKIYFLLTGDGAGSNVWQAISDSLDDEVWIYTGNATWDDGSGASPVLTLIDATNESCAITKLDNGDTTVTIPSDTDFEIVTGNLAVGNGSPGTAAMDGEDMYVEGAFEVDGVATLDGNVTVAGTLTLASGASVNEFSIDDALAGDSDSAVPTEKSVKAYVDESTLNPGLAKGWVIFDGDDATVLASHNVTSVVRDSEGKYTITWDTNFSSANYAIAGFAADAGTTVGIVTNQTDTPLTAGTAVIETKNTNGVVKDYNRVTLIAFGAQ